MKGRLSALFVSFLFLLPGLAFAQQSQPSGVTRWIVFLFPFIFLFGLVYLLFILPAQKQQKRHREMLASLKNGDKIVTSSGIYGTIVRVGDTTVDVRISDKVIVRMDKQAVTGFQPEEKKK